MELVRSSLSIVSGLRLTVRSALAIDRSEHNSGVPDSNITAPPSTLEVAEEKFSVFLASQGHPKKGLLVTAGRIAGRHESSLLDSGGSI